MSSLAPISIYYPTCSHCGTVTKDPTFFVLRNGEMHWACSKECERSLTKKKEIDYKRSLNKLQKMYLEIFLETKMGKKFRKIGKLNKRFYEEV